jgi:hypothetical protein
MKRMIFVIGILSSIVCAEFYQLNNVKRVDNNLYKFDGGYISTKYCYEYTYGEDVIYNDATSELIFRNGSKCSVDKFFR